MKKISLIPCGTFITIKAGGFDAMVTAASIRFDDIRYEVTYFVNMKAETLWLNEAEFELSGERREIGFRK